MFVSLLIPNISFLCVSLLIPNISFLYVCLTSDSKHLISVCLTSDSNSLIRPLLLIPKVDLSELYYSNYIPTQKGAYSYNSEILKLLSSVLPIDLPDTANYCHVRLDCTFTVIVLFNTLLRASAFQNYLIWFYPKHFMHN